MNIINVSKTYTTQSGSYGSAKWIDMMEEIFIPLFSNFNNITYIGKNTVMSPPQYMFSINGAEEVFLQMSIGGNANNPSIRIGFCSSNDITASNTSWIGQYTINPSGMLYYYPAPNSAVLSHLIEFKFYYIKDNNNNLKAWWLTTPAFSSQASSYPHVLATTATNQLIGIDFADSGRGINAFFLNDENYFNYLIPHWSLNYNSDSNILKSSFVPIMSANALTGNCLDAITNNEDIVYMWNINKNISNTGTNASAFNKRLIKIGNTYYRQLVDELWIKDWDGEDIVTNITN